MSHFLTKLYTIRLPFSNVIGDVDPHDLDLLLKVQALKSAYFESLYLIISQQLLLADTLQVRIIIKWENKHRLLNAAVAFDLEPF